MVVTVKVLASIEVTDVELRITDSENGGKGKVHDLVFPKPAGQTSHARHFFEPNSDGNRLKCAIFVLLCLTKMTKLAGSYFQM